MTRPRIGAMLRRDLGPEQLPAAAVDLAPHLDELWIVEDLEWPGGIAQLTTALDATAGTGVAVGHGIAPAPFRHPAALAMEWATLARLHPGRVIGGIGHGLPEWMRSIGLGVDSPLGLLAETIDATTRLLDGEPVDLDGRYVRLGGERLMYPPAERPPILAGVLGPKSLELAGRVADGALLPEGQGPEQVAAAFERLRAGRAAAERNDPPRLTVFANVYCGPLAELPPPPPEIPQGWAAIAESADEVIGRLRELAATGIDALVLVPAGDDPSGQLRWAAEHVAPALREH